MISPRAFPRRKPAPAQRSGALAEFCVARSGRRPWPAHGALLGSPRAAARGRLSRPRAVPGLAAASCATRRRLSARARCAHRMTEPAGRLVDSADELPLAT
ncbi:hypothetical protein C7S17_7324 [Burkholderia thailandensis]|nr:hypothetical protein [Burkholderia thailandensis]